MNSVVFSTLDPKITEIKKDLDEVCVNMIFSLENAIRQNYRLENLEKDTQKIEEDSKQFYKKSNNVKRKSWFGKYKIPIIVSSSTVTTIATFIWLL